MEVHILTSQQKLHQQVLDVATAIGYVRDRILFAHGESEYPAPSEKMLKHLRMTLQSIRLDQPDPGVFPVQATCQMRAILRQLVTTLMDPLLANLAKQRSRVWPAVEALECILWQEKSDSPNPLLALVYDPKLLDLVLEQIQRGLAEVLTRM